MTKFGKKNVLFGNYRARISKNCCPILNHKPQICLIAKFIEEKKCLNLQPKTSYLGIFGHKL